MLLAQKEYDENKERQEANERRLDAEGARKVLIFELKKNILEAQLREIKQRIGEAE
jgi:hypothetical protein